MGEEYVRLLRKRDVMERCLSSAVARLIKVALMALWKYASQLTKWSHLAKPGDGMSCAIRFIMCLSSNYDFITGGIGMESDIKKGRLGLVEPMPDPG